VLLLSAGQMVELIHVKLKHLMFHDCTICSLVYLIVRQCRLVVRYLITRLHDVITQKSPHEFMKVHVCL